MIVEGVGNRMRQTGFASYLLEKKLNIQRYFEWYIGRGMAFVLIFFLSLGASPLKGEEADKSAEKSATTSNDKPYIFLFSGPPGSGRAKLAVKVHTAFAIPHISCAQMVMDLLHEESALGETAREQINKGGELSDEFFLQALFERIKKGDCKNGFVLEGIPRTLRQAQTLLHKLSSSFSFLAFHILVSDDWLIQRAHRRLICAECGRVYQEGISVPKVAMQCDGCGSSLQQRVDDQPKVIAARLKSYRTQLEPILGFYEKEKILVSIKGDRELQEVFQNIVDIIEKRTGLKSCVTSCQR
jgi:adenylate kinase